LDQSRTTPGSGLGLALVFAVLKLHKLDLTFLDNKPGLCVRINPAAIELEVNSKRKPRKIKRKLAEQERVEVNPAT